MPNQLSLLPDERPSAMLQRVETSLIDVPENAVQPSPALRASVVSWGVMQPVLLTRKATGRFFIVDGHRRVIAARAIGIDTVPAMVLPTGTTMRQAAALTLTSHMHRSPNPLHDLLAIQQLQADGYSEQDICDSLRIPRSRLLSRLRLQQLHPTFSVALMRGDISLTQAVRLARVHRDVQTRLLSVPIADLTGAYITAVEREMNPQLVIEGTNERGEHVRTVVAEDYVRARPVPLIDHTSALPTRLEVATRNSVVHVALRYADGRLVRTQLSPEQVVIEFDRSPTITPINVQRSQIEGQTEVTLSVVQWVGGTQRVSYASVQVPDVATPPSNAPEPVPLRMSREVVPEIVSILEGSRLSARRRSRILAALHNIVRAVDEHNENVEPDFNAPLPPLPTVEAGEENWASVLVHLGHAEAALPPQSNAAADACNASLEELRRRVFTLYRQEVARA